MKHKLVGNQNGTVALQSMVALEDRSDEQHQDETVYNGIQLSGNGRNLSARVRRGLSGLSRIDLEGALMRGLAWGNGRGLR